MKKTTSWMVFMLNVMGYICLAYYAAVYLMHSTVVAHPNAMLPIERWDEAGMTLTLGLIPLAAANALGFLYVPWGTKKRRIIMFTPMVIDLILVIHYWATSV